MLHRIAIAFVMFPGLLAAPVAAADLQPRTVAAFDLYVRVSEALMGKDGPFLRIDGLPEAERRAKLEAIRRGDLFIERLTTRDEGKTIDVPGGLVHHWLGSVFVPGATVRPGRRT